MNILHFENQKYKQLAIFRAIKHSQFSDVEYNPVRNLEEGIQRIEEKHEQGQEYDLIITGWWFPLEESGIEEEAAKKLRDIVKEKNWNIPIIVCSSDSYKLDGILGCVCYSKGNDWKTDLINLMKKVSDEEPGIFRKNSEFSFVDFYMVFLDTLHEDGSDYSEGIRANERVGKMSLGVDPKEPLSDNLENRTFNKLCQDVDIKLRMDIFLSFFTGKYRYLPKNYEFKELESNETEVYYDGYCIARTPKPITKCFDIVSENRMLLPYYVQNTWINFHFEMMCLLYKNKYEGTYAVNGQRKEEDL